jgi:hypothetical protein
VMLGVFLRKSDLDTAEPFREKCVRAQHACDRGQYSRGLAV